MSALEPSQPAATDDAIATELRQALLRESSARRWGFRVATLLVVAAALAAGSVYRVRHRPPPPPTYTAAAAAVADVVEQVRAAGVVAPLQQFNVASQTAGVVSHVLVDFNSVVEKGDVLAEIDPSLLTSQVREQTANLTAERAQLQSADAALASAKATHDRAQRLFEKGSASQTELDSARVSLQLAEASAAAARANVAGVIAQLGRARTSAQSTKILAPIDGVVISRDVEPGTVLGAGGAPVLFVLADDLRRMRVIANIDEADVGKLEPGQRAEALVDAYPGRPFVGTVQQVRLNPRTLQGVVTYAAVLEVDNADSSLRPGMTALVTVTIGEARGALVVPNAALRFGDGAGDEPAAPAPTPARPGERAGRVFVLTSAEPGRETIEARQVLLGISDGVHTQLLGATLENGTPVVTDRLVDAPAGAR